MLGHAQVMATAFDGFGIVPISQEVIVIGIEGHHSTSDENIMRGPALTERRTSPVKGDGAMYGPAHNLG